MITGSIVALVTPMDRAGNIDWDCLNRLVDFHLEEGTHAIVAVGTSGESPTLEFDSEHLEVIRRVIKRVNGRIPVIAGTGANSTREAIAWTKAAKEVGADACLLVVPYYNKPTQEGLYQHFKAIAEAVDIPQILYNVPGRTVCDMQAETVVRLSQIPNIVGIKDATGDIERGRALLKQVSKDFAVYSGDDAIALDLIVAGGKGNISVTANVAPRAMSELCIAALAGDIVKAQEIDASLAELNKALFVEANPIPVKWALHEMGLIPEGIRLPLTVLSERYHEQVRHAMRQAGILE
ncbi:4-hydroxy-tetrahydrodipicolinate synthase [Entomomonas asaccharolytica]|uniref:4-hydroxy-tetrahydrodipicolinate synthase n=1 Tax=Entomomonas asaccharolytica TaxID=2785331 RepID=A0A974NHA4_9GAMM|nr:4-hydroxy-tetrahydrodipicolinate synthase [Entomomonas asaccharolytica]QQP86558.1 4-hydroxy-tetrahydrodipicolinate synthase [Entomomonas asaccharolytica]